MMVALAPNLIIVLPWNGDDGVMVLAVSCFHLLLSLSLSLSMRELILDSSVEKKAKRVAN